MVVRRGSRRSRIWLEELEPRWLLSADIAPFAVPEAPFPESAIHEAVVDVLHAANPAIAAPTLPGRFELVFVDARVPDHERLVADLLGQNDGWRHLDVVVLDPERDGISQVTETLASRLQLDAIHFISHGTDGAVQLGGSWLDATSLTANESAVSAWGQSLKADGDMLLYGCDVAASPAGEAFLGQLAFLTQADVAASADFTGAEALGGDWRLEFTLGIIDVDVAISTDERGRWDWLLSMQTLDWDVVDWPTPDPPPNLGPNSYAIGGGNVTIGVVLGFDPPAVTPPPPTRLQNSSPDDVTTDQGGLAVAEQGLYLSSTGFLPGEKAVITIDFAHPGGVSNVSFTIFDIDVGGFIDEVQAGFTASGPVSLLITPSANNTLVAPDTVRGTATTPSVDTVPGDGTSGQANATFTFTGNGITQIKLDYRNVGTESGQSITLHDISFDPTPTAADQSMTIDEDAIHIFSAANFGFSDVGGDMLQEVRITSLETAGALQLNGVDVTLDEVIPVASIGLLTFTPAADANGAPYASFRFQVSDGASFSASDYAMTLNVAAVNDAPTLAPLADQGVNEDAGGQAVLGFATATPGGGADEAGQALSFTVGNDNNALFAAQPTIAANGTLSYTPAANAFGSALVTVFVQDNGGTTGGGQDTTGPLTFTLTVNPVNDAPMLASANNLAGINEDDTTSAGTLVSALIAGQVSDDDPGALAGIAVTGVNNGNGAWQYSTDGGGIWLDFGAPSAAAARLLGTDPNSRVRFVPNADWNGTATIDFRAWDQTNGLAGGTGNTIPNGNATAFSAASATANIAVAAVTDTVDDMASTNEDNAVIVNVLANDNFEDVTRTLTGVSAPANGGLVFNATGSVTYTPNADWNGAEVLTYTVTAGGVTETGSLTITVNPVNDAPSFTLAGNQAINEDAAAQTVAGFAVGAPGGGADEAGQTLAYTVSNNNNALFAVQPTIAANGTLSYAAAANAYGAATVSVFVMDDGGTANGGNDTSATQTFTITVAPAADTPSVTNAATLEDTQTTSGLVISRNPADGAEVTHYKITAVSGGTLFLNDGTTAVASGAFIAEAQGAAGLRFTPAPDSVTPGSFDVQASLAGNDAGLGGSTVTASIAVTAVNDAPSFVLAGNQTVNEDAGAQLVAAFAVGSPGGGPDEAGQTLNYTVSNGNNALFAVQPAVAANGTLTYTPAANTSGSAVVSVLINDSGGTANGSVDTAGPITFTLTVTPVADAPTLTVNPAAGNEDSAIPLSVAAALVDTDGSETLAVTVSAIPVGATLSDGVNAFTATPGNQSALVSSWNLATLAVTPPAHSDVDFTLTVSATATETANGATAMTAANLVVTVDAVADAPAVAITPATGNEDSPIALTVNPALVDADGSETLAVTVSAIPVGATLADGVNIFTASVGNQAVIVSGWNFATLTVTPPLDSDTDFSLNISATATEAANGAAATTNVALTVDVVPVNDAPVLATNAGLNVDEGAAATLTPAMLRVTDIDNTAAQLVYSVTAAPGNGRLERLAAPGVAVMSFTQEDLDSGRIRYVHDGSETTADGFTFTVSDGAGGAIGATAFAITVNPVNDAPVLTVNRLTLTDSQTVTLTLADLDATDPDNPVADLSFAVSGVLHGRFELASAPGVAITNFTYNQLAAGDVRFVHAGGNQVPAYTVTPGDLGIAGAAMAAQITFVPAGDPGDGSVLIQPGDTLIDDPFAVLNPPDPRSSEGTSLGFPEVNAPIPIPRGLENFDVIAPPAEPAFMASARAALPEGEHTGFAKTDPNVNTESMRVLRLPGPVIDFELGRLNFDGPQSRSNIEVLLGMVKMTGFVLTVGAVWWATRAAGLLASALSSIPAWRNFDPIFIVGRDDDEQIEWHRPDEEGEREEEAVAEALDAARGSLSDPTKKRAA